MGHRRDETPRALGPYQDRSKWRVVYRGSVNGEGRREAEIFDNEKDAQKAIDAFYATTQKKTKITIKEGIKLYLVDCERRSLKDSTRETTTYRLNGFFPRAQQERLLRALTPAYIKSCYLAIADAQEGDTHKNTLQEVKRFFRWLAKEDYISKSPAEQIEETGKRRSRKSQLRVTEARRFTALAFELLDVLDLPDPVSALSLCGLRPPAWYHGAAQREDYRSRMKAGVVGALTALLLGVRASEIVQRKVRDLDDDGRLFVIEETEDQDVKTASSERVLEIPDSLRPHLKQLAGEKSGDDFLFDAHDRRWVLHWAKRLCALAGVKVVTAHGLRGSFASIAMSSGAAIHAVSRELGHGSIGISRHSYIQPGAEQTGRARQNEALIVPQSFRKGVGEEQKE